MACAECKREVKIVNVTHMLCSACYSRLKRRGTVERKYMVNTGKCSVVGCDRPYFGKGYCQRHWNLTKPRIYESWKNFRSIANGNYPPEWDSFDVFMAQVTLVIGERPTENHKFRRKNPRLPWSIDNIHWVAPVDPSKQWRTKEERREYQRKWNYLRRFGITIEQYDQKLAVQNGVCAICNKEETQKGRGGLVKYLAVDHDHKTGKIRGLLCARCNHRILGYIKDSIEHLEAAIEYLKKYLS